MFKTGRWRSEKNKIKALFKLHFHASQVAEVAGDSLVISLIPADVGKPTVRSEKAVIKEGCCYWEKPILESLRFFKEPRTGKFQEKIYYFVVSNGWSKADFVGEVSIDFATYAQSYKASSVSLPLKNAKCDALLHVSIQRMQDDDDQREFEEIESATSTPSNNRSLGARLNNSDADERIKSEYTCAPSSPLYDEIPVTPEMRRTNRGSCGSDLTMSSSEGSYGLDTPAEFGCKGNIIQRDPTSVLPITDTSQPGAVRSAASKDVVATDGIVLSSGACLESAQLGADMSAAHDKVEAADRVVLKYEPVACSPPKTGSACLDTSLSAATRNDMAGTDTKVSKTEPVTSDFPQQSRALAELLLNSGSEASIDDSSDSPPRDVFPVEKSEDSSTLLINELRSEISTLRRKAEVAELELQTLRKSIVKESRKGQNLLRELVSLKGERTALRIECEKAKAKNKFEKGDPRALIEELRQELNHEKERNANLRVQLMKMQESNSELILAIQELDEMLEQKDNELINLSNSSISETTGCKEEQKIDDLYRELEMHKRDKEELEGNVEQLVLDYEILKQENHDLLYQIERSEAQEQLKLQYECSSSYATISGLEAQIEKLENELQEQSSKFSDSGAKIVELEEYAKGLLEDLEKQALGFENDIEILIGDKFELEKRAIIAEETLRKTRWQNANTAERIQDEFRRLSVEMTSTLESNEKFTKKSLFEANELRMQKIYLEDMLKKSKEELHSLNEQYEAKLNDLSSQLSSKVNLIELLDNEKARGEENNMSLSEEILILRREIERLEMEKNSLNSELEQVNVSIREMKMVLESEKAEKNEKEREIVYLQDQIEQLENEKAHGEENNSILSEEILLLRKEIETLKREKNSLNGELEKVNISIREMEMVLAREKAEKHEKEREIVQLQDHIEQLENEKLHGHENNMTLSEEILILRKEIEMLKMEYNSLNGELEQVNMSIREKEMVLELEKAEKIERKKEIVYLQDHIQQLENEKAHGKENTTTLLEEILTLSKEIETLKKEKSSLNRELEQVNVSIRENEAVIEREKGEKNEREREINHLQERIGKLENEKAHGEENNVALSEEIRILSKEIETLKMEKNNLTGELEQVNVSIREMEMVLEREKVEKIESERELVHLMEELDSLRKVDDENKTNVKNLESKLEDLRNQHGELKHLLSEVDLEKDNLKNKIELLEDQIKIKEAALENLTSSYLEKERDFQKEMEELEKRLEESCAEKVDEINDAICLDDNPCKESNITTELGESPFSSESTIEQCGISALKEANIGESSMEIVLLKERNKEMANDLKEMQERYSEISLKLAEVEGSRQQLMMRVRNLKNAKKS